MMARSKKCIACLAAMRRDTRSSCRDRTEAGLFRAACGATPAATDSTFMKIGRPSPHKAMLHPASCGQCSSGKGAPPGTIGIIALARPYSNVAEARAGTQSDAVGVLIAANANAWDSSSFWLLALALRAPVN